MFSHRGLSVVPAHRFHMRVAHDVNSPISHGLSGVAPKLIYCVQPCRLPTLSPTNLMPADTQTPSSPTLAVVRDSKNLSRLGSAISDGSTAFLSEILPSVHWTENSQRTDAFWSSFPQRMLDLLKLSTQSEPRHPRICAALVDDEEFSQAFRSFLLNRKTPRFFLGHGSLALQLDVFLGVDTPAARRQICGVACDWSCSGYFSSPNIALFDRWPLAQWLSPAQKLGVAQGWLKSLENADAVANWKKQTPIWLAKQAAAEALLNAGWTDVWCFREIVDTLLLGERPNGPRAWMHALAATDACILAMGRQAADSPYWDLWIESVEDMSKTAPLNLGTDVEWRAFWGKIKAQNEAMQPRTTLTIDSLADVFPHAAKSGAPTTNSLSNSPRV